MTHDQSNIIRRCIAALWEIESELNGPTERSMALLARIKLERLWDNYRPPEPPIAFQTRPNP